jgi:hypothetical protein
MVFAPLRAGWCCVSRWADGMDVSVQYGHCVLAGWIVGSVACTVLETLDTLDCKILAVSCVLRFLQWGAEVQCVLGFLVPVWNLGPRNGGL